MNQQRHKDQLLMTRKGKFIKHYIHLQTSSTEFQG